MSTFTMNWKLTRICEWVRFEKGEPFACWCRCRGAWPRAGAKAHVPCGRSGIEREVHRLAAEPVGLSHGTSKLDPDAVKQGWQKDYFQGKSRTAASSKSTRRGCDPRVRAAGTREAHLQDEGEDALMSAPTRKLSKAEPRCGLRAHLSSATEEFPWGERVIRSRGRCSSFSASPWAAASASA